MKFIVSSSTLLKQLTSISGVLNTSSNLPILGYFLFDVKDKKLIISGSDLESTMITEIALNKADDDIKVCVPAKLLLDMLKTFSDQPLTFSVDPKSFGIEVASDAGKYKLAGSNGDEFPRLPEMESASSMTIESGVLFNAINKTVFATGNDELRPVMSGVYFALEKDGVTFVATDAHKLVKYHRNDCKSGKSSNFIMPKKPLNLLKSLLASLSTDVEVEYNETNASFEFENFRLVSRLIDGKYPNYEAVIPKENPNEMTIDRQLFLNSIRRVSIFSNKTTHQVRLAIKGSEVQVSAEDLDYSNEATERLSCNYKGEDLTIGFNSRFIIEMLNNLESDEVLLRLSAPNRAGLLSPSEKDDAEEIVMLVMPVMLSQ
ncbi:MAG: DNA polymerase III subunit beta [Salibacteraceae bacterium]